MQTKAARKFQTSVRFREEERNLLYELAERLGQDVSVLLRTMAREGMERRLAELGKKAPWQE